MNERHLQKETIVIGLRAGARLIVVLAAIAGPATAAEKRVDNPVDAWMNAQTGAAGKAVEGAWKRRPAILDATDVKTGDFSIMFTVGDPAKESAYGFQPGPFIEQWAVGSDHTLHLWAKAKAEQSPQAWPLVLYDNQGKRAATALNSMAADGKWREFKLPLKGLKADEGFNFGAVRAVQVEAALPKDGRLWLDDVYFKNGDAELGVSDKTITQYMAEAAATRQKRVEAALPTGGAMPGQDKVAALWAGRDLEKTNQDLIEWFRKEKAAPNVAGKWDLHLTTALHMLYFGFSSKGMIKPGRLTPECEKELLELYWKHSELHNDIAIARHSTWWVTGSENHDVNFKVANLLSSQMFVHEPDYAKRIYPDLGRMHGYGYAGGFLMKVGTVAPLGRGKYKDGNKYTAEDHYKAWVTFWKEWFAERAKHGFFIEHNATGYMKYTNKFLHDIYAWCEDEELRRQCRMFMDLVWAQWAQDQVLTCSAGAGTRMRNNGYAAMSELVVFMLGGPANGAEGYFQLLSDYAWPRQVWEMMLDRRGKGEYAYLSRKPNEEQDVWPRPAGLEYTMMIRPDSRLARYSWVTPDYVLGTRMDHPAAIYAHLSMSREGMVFATTPEAFLSWSGLYRRTVQVRHVLVFQQKRNWLSRHPDWFPGWTAGAVPDVVEFGKGLKRLEEKDGWVFVEEGNAYAALRFVSPAPEAKDKPVPVDEEGFKLLVPVRDSYSLRRGPSGGGSMTSSNNLSVVIVEASRREQHPTFEAFQKDVLDNPLTLRGTIGGYLLSYRGCGKDAPLIEFNAGNNEIPTVDGVAVNYDCPTFDSPFLKGEAGSGVVTLTGPISGTKLVLDFNTCARREE